MNCSQHNLWCVFHTHIYCNPFATVIFPFWFFCWHAQRCWFIVKPYFENCWKGNQILNIEFSCFQLERFHGKNRIQRNWTQPTACKIRWGKCVFHLFCWKMNKLWLKRCILIMKCRKTGWFYYFNQFLSEFR